MGDVLAFTRFTEAVALDGAREDYGRAALVFDGRFVSGVDLARVVTAKAEAAKRFIGKRLD